MCPCAIRGTASAWFYWPGFSLQYLEQVIDCNLARLHERIKPCMLRRRKADVEPELPDRTDKSFFTNYILDPNDSVCPKLGELEKILEECRDNPGVKVKVRYRYGRDASHEAPPRADPCEQA